MHWKAYRLVYQAKSPVHIGWHTLGYIKRTRYYIPGKTMWGAMTANLARANAKDLPFPKYKEYGDLLKESILPSYFFPAFESDKPLMPKFTDSGACFGQYTQTEFERIFIRSFGQTAVLPDSNSAEDGSLHESEYIAPSIALEGVNHSVCFVGYVLINKDAKTPDGRKIAWKDASGCINLKTAVSEIYVGGDSKYGWGKLCLSNDPEKEGAQEKIFGYDFEAGGDRPALKIPLDAAFPAHALPGAGLPVRGDIEPLVGRQWGEIENNKKEKEIGAGKEISKAIICWMPGSAYVGDEGPKTLSIGEYGVLS